MKSIKIIILDWLILSFLLSACGSDPSGSTNSNDAVKLTLGAYTTPREAYSEIIPRFQELWFEETGQQVIFEESYLGSGAQSRAVINGFEADIVALSLEADVNRIQDAGLITHDWKTGENEGIVTNSVVSFAVRPGNPLDIQDWSDLAQPGLEVLTPNPQTSGGAMWNMLALYGAAMRGHVAGIPAEDPEAALEFMTDVLRNVTVMDKAARDSIVNFEKGIGDLAITYENEVLVGRQSGQEYELVIPSSTILIQNPVALIDSYVAEHGNRDAAEAFIEFLFSYEAQEIFSRYGLRAVDPEVAASTTGQYPPVDDLFTIDYFGGWVKAIPEIFGEDGVYTHAITNVQGEN